MSLKYKGKKLLSLVVVAISSLHFCGCDDDFGKNGNTGDGLRFDVRIPASWTDGRATAGGDSRCTSISAVDSDCDSSLYLHCDEIVDTRVLPQTSRGALKDAIGNFSLSAICYTGTYPDEEGDNNWTPDFAHNLIYTADGLPADGQQLQWPAGGRVRFFAFSPTAEDSKLDSNPTISISESSRPGTPSITYTVPADVKSQIDLMTACTDATAPNVSLNFRHALTAVKVVASADMWPGKITKVKISGIYGRGTYTFAPDVNDGDSFKGIGGSWVPVGEPDAEYAVVKEVDLPSEGGDLIHTAEGTEIAGEKDDCTFILLPQTLPAGAKLEVSFKDDLTGTEHNLSASIGGKKWSPGRLVTFALSQSSIKVDYKFVIDKNVNDTIPYSGYLKNVGIKAYAEVTEADKRLRVINMPFTIECSENGKDNWLPVDSVKVSSENADVTTGIRQSVYHLCMPPQSQFTMLRDKFKTITDNGKGSEELPHLLTLDTNGETANTYVINDHGYYSLPLVYGNARGKGGIDNTMAYNPVITDEELLKKNFSPFLDHNDEYITGPEIYDRYTPEDAVLVWQDAPELVTGVKLSDDKKHLQFFVDKHTMTQGNAVVAVRGDGGKILWSWQIWVSPYDWSGAADNRIQSKASGLDYYLAPCNLGYCDPHSGDAQRQFYLRCTLDNSEITGKSTSPAVMLAFPLVQDEIIESYAGDNTYYQWGRKDPSVGGVYNAETIENDWNGKHQFDMRNKRAFNGAYKVGAAPSRVTMGKAIQEPYHHFMGTERWSTGTGINATDYRSCWWWDKRYGEVFPLTTTNKDEKDKYKTHPEFYNRWDSGFTNRVPLFSTNNNPLSSELSDAEVAEWREAEKHHCKSVYDPCPAGYHVPNTHVFSYFVKEGAKQHKINNEEEIYDVLSHFVGREMKGSEPIGEKFKDLDNKEFTIYLTGLRDYGYPASERPDYLTGDVYYIPAHRMVSFLASSTSHSSTPKTNTVYIFYFDRRPASRSINLDASSNNAYGFSIRPVHD